MLKFQAMVSHTKWSCIWWYDIFGSKQFDVNKSLMPPLPNWHWSHRLNNNKTKLLNMLATREFMAILNRTKHHYQMFFFAQNEDDALFLIDFFGSRASSKSSTETWVCAMRFMQSSPNQFIGIHFILAIFWFEYTFVQCFSQNMCTLFAHIIYTRLRLFIAMCVYFRNAYIICAHWIDQSNGPAIASVSVCWIFGAGCLLIWTFVHIIRS